jgi:hypothetical protein
MLRTTKYICLAVLSFAVLMAPSLAAAQISVGISVHIGPPPLPVYVQPVCPAPGYIWTPGYWAYGPEGYYWVPGTWVMAPAVGVLWTPGYWGWGSGGYLWHAGYWGPHIGFYGGINYGFGYTGVGFVGGGWRGGVFAYNTAVTNVNTTVIHNTYIDRTVIRNTTINNTTVNRVSYNGGNGGISARPTAQEQMAEHEHHIAPNSMQEQHERAARNDRTLLASVNHGRPAIAATAKPGEFHGQGVVGAREPGQNSNRSVPRPSNANASRPANNLDNNRGQRNNDFSRGSNGANVPRPNADRSNNSRASNDRINNQPSHNRPDNNFSNGHGEQGHSATPHLAQASHPAKSEHESNAHPQGRKDR